MFEKGVEVVTVPNAADVVPLVLLAFGVQVRYEPNVVAPPGAPRVGGSIVGRAVPGFVAVPPSPPAPPAPMPIEMVLWSPT